MFLSQLKSFFISEITTEARDFLHLAFLSKHMIGNDFTCMYGSIHLVIFVLILV